MTHRQRGVVFLFSSLCRHGAALTRRFAEDRRGLSVVTVGLGLIPIMFAIGMAFDVTRAHLLRSRLSASVDAAALAGGRVFFEADRDQDIEAFFKANFPDNFLNATVEGPTPVANMAAGVLTVSASARMPTVFMRLAGVNEIRVAATGTTTRRSVPLDVVLAIDISGSMLGNIPGESTQRLQAAKDAAKKLIDILYGDPVSSLVRVGVVPWAGKVNVTDMNTTYGKGPSGETLTMPTDPRDPGGAGYAWQAVDTGTSYVNPYRTDKYRFSYIKSSQWSPNDWAVDNYDQRPAGAPANAKERLQMNMDTRHVSFGHFDTITHLYYAHNSVVPFYAPPSNAWKGCVYSRYAFTGQASGWNMSPTGRDKFEDADNAADIIDGPVAKYGPASLDWVAWMPMGIEGDPQAGSTKCDMALAMRLNEECTPCPTVGIYRLKNNKPGVIAAVDSLAADGSNYTNIPEGLAWAWRVVSPQAPFVEAATPPPGTDPKRVQRAIVLLTDGENTVRAGDAYNGSLSNRNRRDERLRALAANIKAEDILIYTVQFANGDGVLANLMKDVATERQAPFYHYAPSSEELERVFQTVANNLAELRLSK